MLYFMIPLIIVFAIAGICLSLYYKRSCDIKTSPRYDRIDSSFVNPAWKEDIDSIYSKLVSCGMENISKEDIAKTFMSFLHSEDYEYLLKDKSVRRFALDMVYASYAVLQSSDSLLVDLLKRFNVINEGFFYVIIKLFQLNNRLNKDFFEDAIMKKNKSDIKNFVEYINTGYGIEGWTLKQCYTKAYE